MSTDVKLVLHSHLPSPAELGQLAGRRERAQEDLAANLEARATLDAAIQLLTNLYDGAPQLGGRECMAAIDYMLGRVDFLNAVNADLHQELQALDWLLDGQDYRGWHLAGCYVGRGDVVSCVDVSDTAVVVLVGDQEVVLASVPDAHEFVDAVLDQALALTSRVRDDGTFELADDQV